MKGQLYDLTQPFCTDMLTTDSLGPFKCSTIFDLDNHPFQLSRISFASHLGCHLDAPRHYFKEGMAIGDIPLERLVSRCVVIDARKGAFGLITPKDVQSSGLEVRKGDFVFFYTGWDGYFSSNSPAFFEGASLSEDLAQWLVDAGVSLVGIDTCTVDLAHGRRGPDFQFPIHRKLLSNHILIAECLKLDQVAGKELQAFVMPMYIKDCDGAPARVAGIEL